MTEGKCLAVISFLANWGIANSTDTNRIITSYVTEVSQAFVAGFYGTESNP